MPSLGLFLNLSAIWSLKCMPCTQFPKLWITVLKALQVIGTAWVSFHACSSFYNHESSSNSIALSNSSFSFLNHYACFYFLYGRSLEWVTKHSPLPASSAQHGCPSIFPVSHTLCFLLLHCLCWSFCPQIPAPSHPSCLYCRSQSPCQDCREVYISTHPPEPLIQALPAPSTSSPFYWSWSNITYVFMWIMLFNI